MSELTEMLGLAGEYAVAAELCRRGAYCQLTFGNKKKTDLLVDTGKDKDGLFRVSVKAKRGRVWPKISGIWQSGDLIVFVDYSGKEINKDDFLPPDFYVLDVHAWKSVVASIQKKNNDSRAKIDSENTLYWPVSGSGEKGWKGCSVLVEDVCNYKNAWPKF